MINHSTWEEILQLFTIRVLAILVLYVILASVARATENPLECIANAPTSAHYCKPGTQPGGGKVKIERRSRYGNIENPNTYCEVQMIWVAAGVCNYCRVQGERCGST